MSKTKGSVSIHKKGRYILPIAENAYAAEVLREITERNKIDIMCQSRYYGMSTSFHWKKGKVEIYNYLGTPINDIPIVKILKEYGLEVKVSDTLANYMKKEYRRQKLESTPLPIHAVDQEIPLFERCVEGITLLCKIEFKVGGVKKPLFEKGKRYLITGVGAEGTESVKISTVPMGGSAVISDQASSSNYTWSLFDESMDTYFTDSDDGKIDKDITQIYPEFIEQNKKKLMKMPIYPLLYEHVAVDAINSANKRGVMNAYPMRMAVADTHRNARFCPRPLPLYADKPVIRPNRADFPPRAIDAAQRGIHQGRVRIVLALKVAHVRANFIERHAHDCRQRAGTAVCSPLIGGALAIFHRKSGLQHLVCLSVCVR